MAFDIVYKTFFEVQIISDYHLANPQAFYDLLTGETPEDQIEELLLHQYNVLKDLQIEPTEACRARLKGHQMVFKPTPFGFMVGIKVREQLDGVDAIYEPFVMPQENTRWGFHLRLRNPEWINFSNIRVNPNVAGKFYFSNQDANGELTFPYLSLPPVPYAAGRRYEMGEWVQQAGTVYQASVNVDSNTAPGNPGWDEFSSTVRYATYRDQCLLPLKFPYRFTFDAGTPVLSADFELTSATGTGGATLTVGETGGGPIRSHQLDFSDEPPGRYALQVTSPEGYLENKELILDPARYDHRDFGFIEIVHDQDLGPFRLLEANGRLRTENGILQHPVFRIAFRNRATYWQYFLHAGDDPNRINDSEYVVDAENGYLVTTQPQLLTLAGTDLSVQNVDSEDFPLPSPRKPTIKPRPDKFYSEIYLPKMNI